MYHFLWSISWLLSISINYYPSSIIVCRSTAMPGRRKPPTKTTSAVAKHAPALPGTRTPVRVSQSATTTTRGAGLSTCADVVCDLCCTNIRENEEDAVQREGACGMWYHRYCIGVSRSQFQKLAVSDTPFVCQYCSMALQAARITQLESLVSSLMAW